MIESSNAKIDRLVVHQMGCKAEGGVLHLSRSEMPVEDGNEMMDILKQFFFKPFKTEAYFNMTHPDGLDSHQLYQHVTGVFEDQKRFFEESTLIAQLLFETSNHPKIKGGEFYMAHFENCVVDGQTCDAVGIFKSESKETFLKVFLSGNDSIELGAQEGISIRRLDKGCIIFNMEQEEGYRVCAVDNINKGQEAHFWMDEFLGLKPRQDDFFFTNNYMKMCHDFVTDVFNDENHVPRTEQMDMMNRTVDFFQKNPQFSHEQFSQRVMEEPEIISAFNDYKQKYESENQMEEPLPEEFAISKDAVKGEKKNFKSILKLDKNFHVYVHGSRYYMEKGYDEERDMNYYKLFFKIES